MSEEGGLGEAGEFLARMREEVRGDRGKITGREAAIELPGKGKFFVWTDVAEDGDGTYRGYVYLIDDEAYPEIKNKGTIGEVMQDEKLRGHLDEVFRVTRMTDASKNQKGLMVTAINEPPNLQGRADGVMEAVLSADKQNALLASMREVLRLTVKKRQGVLKREGEIDLGMMVEVGILGEVSDRKVLAEKMFEGIENSGFVQDQKFDERFKTRIPVAQFE